MVGRIRFSFRLRVLVMLLGTCWLLAGAFMVFQYHREKDYKTGMMNARLQMHNARLLDDLREGQPIESVVARVSPPAENLRVTLVGKDGAVVYDSRTPALVSNHNFRPEVRDARRFGEGYAIERVSEGSDASYFYSALLGDDGMVIRSAALYTHSLTAFLEADRTMLWIIGVMTLAVSLAGMLATRKIALSIRRLNLFAEKAEKGEKIFSGFAFPHDELGNIAANIVKLYVQRDEQHRAAISLEQDKARLKKQLTDNINHELKTPVASILLNLDLIDRHPDIPSEKKQEIMCRIRSSAERLSELLKDVATLTHAEEGRGRLERKQIDLKELINRVAEEARLRTDMLIRIEVPDLHISGERRLLESIFVNLIDNAVAYSGGTEICVTADTTGHFHLWDNGRGVAEEHLPHIFERFYRVDNGRARSSGGTGLGLSIVRNAVAVHGGAIRAFSTNGLHFEFNLAVE